MFYTITVRDFIRVPPSMFNAERDEAILKKIRKDYTDYLSKDLGYVIDVIRISNVSEGRIVPGDGAAFYNTEFELLCYRPELNELVYGSIRDLTDFGAFIELGGVEGMCHISQTMDDFVSFSKEKVLQGRDNGGSLKVGDFVISRIIAVSFKDLNNPKIGLTMRQEGLGKA